MSAPKRPMSALARNRGRTGMLLTAPAFAFVALLLGIPILQAVYYSMTKWDGIVSVWIGPSTYVKELKNPLFWQVIGWRFFRSIYFLPTAVSWVVIGMVSARFFAQEGMLNNMLAAVGLGAIKTDFLAGERTALLAVAVTFIWSMVGTNTIIFLTGLATIDPALHEAARVDGAGSLRIFWHITLPQLKRFVQFSFVMTVISAFTALFSLIFVMTGGGPGYGTTTLEFFVYQTAFAKGEFGTGALLGVILFVIMAAIGLAQLKLLRSDD